MYRYFLIVFLTFICQASFAKTSVRDLAFLPEDTVEVFDKYDSLFLKVGNNQPGKNIATNDSLDFSRYLLENRFLNSGDNRVRRWFQHFYISGGIGLNQLASPSGGIKFSPMNTVNLNAGNLVNKLNSIRLGLFAGIGYQQQYGRPFYQVGLKVDHLFDFSAFNSGYRPDRPVSLSSVLGIGVAYDRFVSAGKLEFEGHAGLQVRLYTGPQGYVDFEPYFGLLSDRNGLNKGKAAWRRFNMNYGLNVSYVYFLEHHTTPESRRRAFQKSRPKDRRYVYGEEYVVRDTIIKSMRSPIFTEVGVGAVFNFGANESWSKTLGHTTRLAFGKWFSPAIGARLSYTATQTTWGKTSLEGVADDRTVDRKVTSHALSSGLYVEALLNPLGFLRHANYDATAGFHFIVGASGIGFLTKYDEQESRNYSTAITAGFQVWKKVSPDIRLFIEPHYTHHSYNVSYQNVDWYKQYARDNFSITAGVSVFFRPKRFRNPEPAADETCVGEFRHWRVGGGGGIPVPYDRFDYNEGYLNFNFGVQGYGIYDFTPIHGIRLGYDYCSVNQYTIERSKEILQASTAPENEPMKMNKRDMTGNYASLAYNVSLSNLFSGYSPRRRWNVDLYAGGLLGYSFSMQTQIYRTVIDDQKRYAMKREVRNTFRFGFTGGMSIQFHCTKLIDVYAATAIALHPRYNLTIDSSLSNLQIFQTINAGVQFRF